MAIKAKKVSTGERDGQGDRIKTRGNEERRRKHKRKERRKAQRGIGGVGWGVWSRTGEEGQTKDGETELAGLAKERPRPWRPGKA